MRRSRRGLFAATLALALLACAAEESEPVLRAPSSPRATLILEPPQVGLGEVAVLEVAVVTPPDHQVRPFRPPESVPGFWLLDAETPAVEKQADRWLHRTRLRIRAREVGRFQWPVGRVELETPDGSLATLELESIPLEVLSVIPEYPEQQAPFGARAPEAPQPTGGGVWTGAVLGALSTLAVLGLVALVRRRREARAQLDARTRARETADPPWVEARTRFESARRSHPEDPLLAAHLTASGLRRYVAHRFHADTEARTTEELDSAAPPFAATSRWPELLKILHGLDALRFPPPHEPDLGARVAEWIDLAEAFVEDSVPPESRS